MGTLLGHLGPGTFFVTVGIWWACNIFFRYYKALLHGPGAYTSTFSFLWRKRIPLDMYFILIVGIPGIQGNIRANWPHVQVHNLHHITMYFLFYTTAIARILKVRKWKLPDNLEYVLFAMTFFVQGMLFYFHTHGRSQLDVSLHLFLCYTDALIAVCLLLEMVYPQSVLPALAKCLFMIVQGCWLYLIGFVLFPVSGDPVRGDNHDMIMMVPAFYTWILVSSIWIMALIGTCKYYKVRVFQKLVNEKDPLICDEP